VRAVPGLEEAVIVAPATRSNKISEIRTGLSSSREQSVANHYFPQGCPRGQIKPYDRLRRSGREGFWRASTPRVARGTTKLSLRRRGLTSE